MIIDIFLKFLLIPELPIHSYSSSRILQWYIKMVAASRSRQCGKPIPKKSPASKHCSRTQQIPSGKSPEGVEKCHVNQLFCRHQHEMSPYVLSPSDTTPQGCTVRGAGFIVRGQNVRIHNVGESIILVPFSQRFTNTSEKNVKDGCQWRPYGCQPFELVGLLAALLRLSLEHLQEGCPISMTMYSTYLRPVKAQNTCWDEGNRKQKKHAKRQLFHNTPVEHKV